MVSEEEKIIICSLVAAGASLESTAAGYRLMGEIGKAQAADQEARRLKGQAAELLDGREL